MNEVDYGDYGESVAIIGASSDRSRMSNKAVRAFKDQGFVVYPIHPMDNEIEGLHVYRNLGEIFERITIVSMYLGRYKQSKTVNDLVGRRELALVIFNSEETENPHAKERLENQGIDVLEECSIVGLGRHPDEFPDE